jgi:Cu-Zn family superoxide dismutase
MQKLIQFALISTSLAFAGAASAAPMAFAKADMAAKSGSKVGGLLVFTSGPAGLSIKGRLENLSPGEHGIHIHEKGDCSAADASSAGGHYNPVGMHHGSPTGADHHTGDFGNVVADPKGVAEVDIGIPTPTSKKFTGWNGIVGKSIVVHAKRDDLKTQPSGDSGDRVACGTIRPTKVE